MHLHAEKISPQQQLEEIAKNIAEKDRNVDQIVFDAKYE